jgi:hypothetical protein
MLGDLANLRRRLQASPLDDTTALIEAATLYRSVTGPAVPRRAAPSGAAGLLDLDALTSFETAAAAERFAVAITRGTGIAPRVDSQVRGIRHRHEMHLVHLDDHSHGAVLAALSGGWRAAHAGVLATVPVAGDSPRARRATSAAIAIWRALLLSITPVRNNAELRLRLRDPELLSLAVRAAAVLGVHTRTRTSGTLGVLSVDEPEHVYRLLNQLLPRIPAMRRPTSVHRGPTRPATRPAALPGPGRVLKIAAPA